MEVQSLDPSLLRIVSGVTISETRNIERAVYYVIDVMTNQGHYWQVKHRYSDFDELADDLCQDIGLSHRAELPGKLPRKSLFSGEKIIEKRKKGLAKFLVAIIQDPRCIESNVLANFLCFNAETKNIPDGPVKTADDNTFYSAEALRSKGNLDIAPSTPSSSGSKVVSKKPPRPGPPGKKLGRPPPPGSAAGRPAPPGSSAGRPAPPGSSGSRPAPPRKAGPPGRIPPPSASAGRVPPPISSGRVPPPSKATGPPSRPAALNSSSKAPVPPVPPGVNNSESGGRMPPPVPQSNAGPQSSKKLFSATPMEGRKAPIPIVKGKKFRKPTNVIANSGSSKNLDSDIDSAPPPIPNSRGPEPTTYDTNNSQQDAGKRLSGRKAFPGGAMPDLSKVKLRSTKGGFSLGSKTSMKRPEENSGMTEFQRKMAARRQKVDSSHEVSTQSFAPKKKIFTLGSNEDEISSSVAGVSKAPPRPVQSKPPPKPFTSKAHQSKPTPPWVRQKIQQSNTPPWVKKKTQESSTPPWVKKKTENVKSDPTIAGFTKHPTPPNPSGLASVPPRFKKPDQRAYRKSTEPDTPPAPYSAGMVGGKPPDSGGPGSPTPMSPIRSTPPPIKYVSQESRPHQKNTRIPPPSKARSAPPPVKAKSPPPAKSKAPPPAPVKSKYPPPTLVKSQSAPSAAKAKPPPKAKSRGPPPKRNTLQPTTAPPKPKSFSGRPGPPSKFNGRPPPPSKGVNRDPSGRPMPPGYSRSNTATSRPPPPKKTYR